APDLRPGGARAAPAADLRAPRADARTPLRPGPRGGRPLGLRAEQAPAQPRGRGVRRGGPGGHRRAADDPHHPDAGGAGGAVRPRLRAAAARAGRLAPRRGQPAMNLLVVQHQETCPPGRVGEWLGEMGGALDVRRPYAGEPLPTDLTARAGLVVRGGQMGCHDDETAPWLTAARELIRTAAEGAVPTLGICLGHQLASVALGGEAGRNATGRTVGMFTANGTAALDEDEVLAGAAGAPVVQWNDDVVTRLPSGATALATNERGDLLLARLAPTVWGVQGHPE